MSAPSPDALVERFNTCITRRDLSGLVALISDTHLFVDSAGGEVRGKAAVTEAWRGFFSMFPDYENHFDEVLVRGPVVAIRGRSACSDPRLSGPALWKAVVQDALIAEWHVLEDTPDARIALGFPA